MKKSLIILSVASLLLSPIIAYGITIPDQPRDIDDLPTLINSIVSVVWQVFVGLAVVMLIIAGILFLTAAGNPEKVQQARNAFLWGVVGVVVAIVAFSVTVVMKNVLST